MMTCKKLFIEIGIGLCILLSVGFLCTLVGSEPISLSSIRESPQNAQIFFEVRIPIFSASPAAQALGQSWRFLPA
jgi:hypothetical protein